MMNHFNVGVGTNDNSSYWASIRSFGSCSSNTTGNKNTAENAMFEFNTATIDMHHR